MGNVRGGAGEAIRGNRVSLLSSQRFPPTIRDSIFMFLPFSLMNPVERHEQTDRERERRGDNRLESWNKKVARHAVKRGTSNQVR